MSFLLRAWIVLYLFVELIQLPMGIWSLALVHLYVFQMYFSMYMGIPQSPRHRTCETLDLWDHLLSIPPFDTLLLSEHSSLICGDVDPNRHPILLSFLQGIELV